MSSEFAAGSDHPQSSAAADVKAPPAVRNPTVLDVKSEPQHGAIHEASERVRVHVDERPAINANCLAAWEGRVDALKAATQHLYEVGVVHLDGAPHALFHVSGGEGKPYRLLPLADVIEQPAPVDVNANKAKKEAEESYFAEQKGGETPQVLPPFFAFWRSPVFLAAAAGKKDAVTVILERHAGAGSDRARIYTAKKAQINNSKWEVVENAHEQATTPKPKFVTAADVARANGYADIGAQLDKSYRACTTEDCVIM